ncbi:hypothetical protein D8674_025610 [Pyrus ussuriensis x Pyrus communis]|uniref:Uncharacterized protein n=1 Tax=Pyrus ussuriensis x Pyrus communis TaxID=2448454 RepID=A0A5N5I4J2_9ROSA|nr:hypothetical protein D8674_025610 [Pyrus ussuriensis x Pyrus communis]
MHTLLTLRPPLPSSSLRLLLPLQLSTQHALPLPHPVLFSRTVKEEVPRAPPMLLRRASTESSTSLGMTTADKLKRPGR